MTEYLQQRSEKHPESTSVIEDYNYGPTVAGRLFNLVHTIFAAEIASPGLPNTISWKTEPAIFDGSLEITSLYLNFQESNKRVTRIASCALNINEGSLYVLDFKSIGDGKLTTAFDQAELDLAEKIFWSHDHSRCDASGGGQGLDASIIPRLIGSKVVSRVEDSIGS